MPGRDFLDLDHLRWEEAPKTVGPLGTACIKRHARRKLLLFAYLMSFSLESDIICCSSIVLLILQRNSLGFQHLEKTICDMQHFGMNNYQILSLPFGRYPFLEKLDYSLWTTHIVLSALFFGRTLTNSWTKAERSLTHQCHTLLLVKCKSTKHMPLSFFCNIQNILWSKKMIKKSFRSARMNTR